MTYLKKIFVSNMSVISAFCAITISLMLAILLLWFSGAPPIETGKLLLEGSLGNATRLSDTSMVWVPLALASASLIITFAAGLWNIGVEGQIIVGAIFASFVAREFDAPPPLLWGAMIMAGALGGMFWGGLTGLLRIKGKVNEIFGGLGLTFVATGIVIYLVIGPWKRAGIASTSGTAPFDSKAWFPTIMDLRVSPLAILLALAGLWLVYYLLKQSKFGLQLRATGINAIAASRLGVRTERNLMLAFLLGGILAGIAGTVQVGAMHHKLVPSISGGYGYLAILVVLLGNYKSFRSGLISFFFAMIAVGSIQWQLRLDLHSSLGGVTQGILVLVVLVVMAIFAQYQRNQRI